MVNESQERYVLAVEKDSLKEFKEFCEREKCPHAVVGTLTAKKLLNLKIAKRKIFNPSAYGLFGYKEKNTHEIISTKRQTLLINLKK